MAFEGKAINFLTSLSSINLFSTTMCTTCEGMASFRPLAFELEAKEICPPSTSSHSQQELLPDLTVLPSFDSSNSGLVCTAAAIL